MRISFSYITPDGSTVSDIILSGEVDVAEHASEQEISDACFQEACRIMREDPARVLNSTVLVKR